MYAQVVGSAKALRHAGSVLVLALGACASAGPGVEADPIVSADFFDAEPPHLPRAHSHNDYWQPRPLAGALERGFASIEVDVVLVEGELLVAHGPDEVEEGVTLSRLYLDPLRDLVRRNRGTVFGASRPPLQLLIDAKSDSLETHAALHRTLEGYADILTVWVDGTPRPGAVTAVLTGNRATAMITAETTRYLAIDGRVLDDRSGVSADEMPLVSADWEQLGPPVLEARLSTARDIVQQMHAEGRKVRFWGTPEDEALWGSLVALGVDYVQTDDPARLERWLLRGETAVDD